MMCKTEWIYELSQLVYPVHKLKGKIQNTNSEDKIGLGDWQIQMLQARKCFRRWFLAQGEQIFVN